MRGLVEYSGKSLFFAKERDEEENVSED